MKIENLNLSSLKYFIDTVETQSFTKASAINHVSRPAISQAIKRLEEWSGLKLLNHQKKTLELTKEGQDFYRKSKISFDNFQRQLTTDKTFNDTLKVGCSSSLTDQFLLPALKQFKNPPRLKIKVGTSTQLKRFLEEGLINIAIFIDNPSVPGFDSKVISKGHFVMKSKSGNIGSLIVLTEERPEVTSLRSYLSERKIMPEIVRTESWSLGAKIADALGGSYLAPDFMENLKLKKVSLPGFSYKYRVVLASKRQELLSDAELKFTTYLVGISR